MVYQHHRFNMAAVFPVGDFILQTSGWTGRPPHSLFAALDGFSPISAALPEEMADAIAAIRASSEARELLDGSGDAARRLADLRAAVPAVDDYLRTVECRILDGFEPVNPTLSEQPELVLGKLGAALRAKPGESQARAEAFAAELRSEVPEEHRAAFDEVLDDARANYRLRDERGVYSDVTAIGLLRLALLEIGRRAQARGHIAEAAHILDATTDEAVALLGSDAVPAEELSARGERRRALSAEGPPRYLGPPPPPPPSADELPPPLARLMSATGFMIGAILDQLDEPAGDDSSIVGLAASAGTYEGPARLISSIDDLLEIEPGDVVVAPTTGEAFNSVLHLVGAIVTDHGSHASHAAIVSREMGFPGVVGTVNATTRISTGDRIRVDGTLGEVTVLR